MLRKVLEKSSLVSVLTLLLLTALLLTACFNQADLSEEVSFEPTATPTVQTIGRGIGGTLRVLNWEAPSILNPHLSEAYKDWELGRVTYEPLATFDKDGNMIPLLAAEIPGLENGGVAADGTSVTWKLKKDIKWSDGEPFTADDVLFTYELVTNPEVKATTATAYEAVGSVEVIDDYTVKVNFKEPTSGWTIPFVGIQGMILPRHKFEAYNGANIYEAPANQVPVGTGPYRALPPGIKPQEVIFLGSELIETNKAVYEPNPYYREEDKPFFSRLELKGGGTDAEAARAVLQYSEVDYAIFLSLRPPEELVELAAMGEGKLVTILVGAVERLALNRTDSNQETESGERSSLELLHPFFSDKRVRQAFAHAINREAIAELYGPAGRPTTNNLVAPPQYNSPNVFYEFDLDKAAALLDEAGWVDTDGDGVRDKDGVKMKVVFQAVVGATVQKTQEIVKKDLGSIGVEVELKITDPGTFYGSAPATNPNNQRRFNADMMEFTHTSFTPDPSDYLRDWTCDEIPQQANNWSGLNLERWCNLEYDALYQQTLTELDPEKRRQLFIQMNDMLIEDVVMIPMVNIAWVSGAAQDMEGIDLSPWETELWNIQDWRRSSP